MGKVIVVGIGPGSYEDMTIRADRALQSCDAIVGYGVYVDLVKERYPDKAFYETPMTQEAKRCDARLCRHQPERPSDTVGDHRKAPDARGKGRPDHRPLQSREPFAARTFEACV